MTEPEALGGLFESLIPNIVDEAILDHARYVPDDAVCPACTRFLPGHQKLEQILALRRLKYWDEDKKMMQYPHGSVPYCNCEQTLEQPRPRYAE